MEKTCLECGISFEATGRNVARRKYCSKACQVKQVRRNHYNRYPEKHRARRIKHGEDWVRKILYTIKSRAKSKGIDFNLEHGDIELPTHCPILGVELKKVHGASGKVGYRPNAPSVDRIDPNKGYVKGNVRVISSRANLLKNNAEVWELEKVLEDLKCHKKS